MVPATNDKITVQLAKIITIPAHQLAQCHLQTSTGTNKPGIGGSPGGISLLGSPLTVRALAPVNVAPGTQVMRLTMPSQAHQTLLVSQPGSIAGRAGTVTVTSANHTMTAQPHIISGVINGSELVIGAPGTRGVALEKLKAAGVQVQTLQLPVTAAVQQNVQHSEVDAEVDINLQSPDVTMKTEEPECWNISQHPSLPERVPLYMSEVLFTLVITSSSLWDLKTSEGLNLSSIPPCRCLRLKGNYVCLFTNHSPLERCVRNFNWIL